MSTLETLELLRKIRDQLAVSLAWDSSEALRSEINRAIMRLEDSL